jgi:hypothetical protein
MPRKSAASLTIIPRVPGRGRPDPPDDLDAIEQRIWHEVVDALPGHWLDAAGQSRLPCQSARRSACASSGRRVGTDARRPFFSPRSTAR